MGENRLAAWKRYGIALVSSTIAILLVAWMSATWAASPPLVFLVLAIIVSAHFGGFGPSMVATALCTLASLLLVATPRNTLNVEDPINRVELLSVFVIGLVVSTIGGSLRRWRLQSAYERLGRLEAERARLELQRTATERLRMILDRAYDAFVAMSVDGKIIDWNPAAESMFGWTRDEAVGRMLVDTIIPPEFREAHNRGLARFIQTGEGVVLNKRLELRGLRRDGTVFPIELTISPIAEGGERFFAAFIHDITSRLAAAEEISRLSRANQAILDFAGEGIYGLDLKGHTTFINPASARMTGWTIEELKGKSQHAVVHHTKPDGSAYPIEECPIFSVLKDGSVRHVADEVFWRKDGTSFPVEYSSSAIRDENQQVIGAVVVFRDITRRREAEQAMEEQRHELERSNAELQQFAYVASHDLQEPLRMVASYTQLLARRYKGKLGQDADEFIHYAVDGAQRMQVLINDLLTYSRVGTRGRAFEQVEVGDILKIALANLKVAIEENNADITVGEMPSLVGDRSQLAQLFQNLLSNAIKFRDEARPLKITVTAERVRDLMPPPEDTPPDRSALAAPSAFAAPRHNASGAIGPADAWRFEVKDNGIGISPEHFDRIFVIFQRLHTRDDYAGTGIGLAICRKIVERHGGKLWVKSVPGDGSAFLFTIPDRPVETAGNGQINSRRATAAQAKEFE